MVPTSRIPTFQEWKNEFENTFVAWLVKAWWWLWQVTGFCRNCWNSTSRNRNVEHSFPSTLVYFPSLFWMVLCWTLQDLKNFGELDWLCWSAFHGLFQSGVPVHGWLVYKWGLHLKKTGQPDFKKDLGCFAKGNSKQVANVWSPKESSPNLVIPTMMGFGDTLVTQICDTARACGILRCGLTTAAFRKWRLTWIRARSHSAVSCLELDERRIRELNADVQWPFNPWMQNKCEYCNWDVDMYDTSNHDACLWLKVNDPPFTGFIARCWPLLKPTQWSRRS